MLLENGEGHPCVLGVNLCTAGKDERQLMSIPVGHDTSCCDLLVHNEAVKRLVFYMRQLLHTQQYQLSSFAICIIFVLVLMSRACFDNVKQTS